MSQQQTFRSFADFYPYYLEEHSDVNCRRLHFVGSLLVILVTLYAIVTAKFLYLWLREKPTRHLQTPTVQFDGRLGDVQRYARRADPFLNDERTD